MLKNECLSLHFHVFVLIIGNPFPVSFDHVLMIDLLSWLTGFLGGLKEFFLLFFGKLNTTSFRFWYCLLWRMS